MARTANFADEARVSDDPGALIRFKVTWLPTPGGAKGDHFRVFSEKLPDLEAELAGLLDQESRGGGYHLTHDGADYPSELRIDFAAAREGSIELLVLWHFAQVVIPPVAGAISIVANHDKLKKNLPRIVKDTHGVVKSFVNRVLPPPPPPPPGPPPVPGAGTDKFRVAAEGQMVGSREGAYSPA